MANGSQSIYGNGISFKIPSMDDVINGVGMPTLYRVAGSEQLDSIFTYGYNRAYTATRGGNMYGPGVYCTFNLRDSIENLNKEYGDCIIEMRLIGGFRNFIIFDEKLARQTYGDRWRIEHQFADVAKFSSSEIKGLMQYFASRGIQLYHGRTSSAALHIWNTYSSDIFKKHGVRGLIYKGNRDGHCALPYDFSAVIPYAVSFDKGRTFSVRFNNGLYNFIKEHADVDFRFGGKYEPQQSVLGFTIVKDKNNGSYNVIDNERDEPISPIWFSDMVGQINPSNGIFKFICQGVQMDGKILNRREQEEYEDTCCIYDMVHYEPMAPFSVISEVISDVRQNGFSRLVDFILNGDDDDGDTFSAQTESRGISDSLIGKMLRESINRFLIEDRQVGDDGIVTIDNFDDAERLLLNPQSDDDVWFVQIIKRHKDNPHLHFEKNACEYISSYLVHNADELESKRSEIMAVCKSTNSRAYMHPNKRSMVTISDYASNVLKPRFLRHKNYSLMGHELDIAAGQAKDWADRKLCFLDIDSNDENVYNKVISILKDNGITPLWEYRSMNNGWHILIDDKEKVKGIDFSVIDNGKDLGRWSTVGLEIDKPILLYARLRPNGYDVQQRVQQRKIQKMNR